ncbi:MAG: peptidoglycan-binding protein, partial [Pseudomonadota bacterium]|nr:peptidoglycan-binding protein [Pseudomonadota bacterium]
SPLLTPSVSFGAAPAEPMSSRSALAAAGASAVPGPPAIVDVADLKAQLGGLGSDEASAWRALAALWRIAADVDADAGAGAGAGAGSGSVCAAAARRQVHCSKLPATSALLRSLDRPGFLNLRDGEGKAVSVVLLALDGDTAIVAGRDGVRHSVAWNALRSLWRGEFGTLWRVPTGYTTALGEGASGPLVDRLATQLASVAGEPQPVGVQSFDAAMRDMLLRFQSTHGLTADGKAGPATFMQINRATGVDEPKLLVAGTAH